MMTMSKLAPDSIVNPILLSDIEHEGQSMKLLVTEWSCADEQFCNQFVSLSIAIDVYAIDHFLLTSYVHLYLSNID